MMPDDIPASSWAIVVGSKDDTISELRKKIEEQAKQNATLKVALVGERMKYDLLFPEMWDTEDRRDAAKLALKQLAQEYPDIFKEEACDSKT